MDEEKHIDGQIPLHRRIAEDLSRLVTGGSLKPGGKLPSEREIAQRFRSSRATVRTALQHLEQAGLITRRDRRSAVVAIRRDITPQLRVSCSSAKLMNALAKLSDTQVLPPRCQLQQLDLQQPGAISQFTMQPAIAGDMLVCEFEHINCFRTDGERGKFPSWLLAENLLNESIQQFCGSNEKYLVVPLTMSPMVVYFSKSAFAQIGMQGPDNTASWPDWLDVMTRLSGQGRYGFQFRPGLAHMAALMSNGSAGLYRSDGSLAANSSAQFDEKIRLIHSLLHVRKVSPILARADQINLFAAKRCAMALDGAEMFWQYRDKLGDDLGITTLPGGFGAGGILNGLVVIVPTEREELQPVQDFLRGVTSLNAQRMLGQYGMGLSVRNELANRDALMAMGLSDDRAAVFADGLKHAGIPNTPFLPEHKQAVDAIFLEMWLGLDDLDNIMARLKAI